MAEREKKLCVKEKIRDEIHWRKLREDDDEKTYKSV